MFDFELRDNPILCFTVFAVGVGVPPGSTPPGFQPGWVQPPPDPANVVGVFGFDTGGPGLMIQFDRDVTGANPEVFGQAHPWILNGNSGPVTGPQYGAANGTESWVFVRLDANDDPPYTLTVPALSEVSVNPGTFPVM